MTTIPQERIRYGLIYNDTRKNAIRRNIPFLLTRLEFDTLVEKADGRCMVSGASFTSERIAGSSRRPYMPSLDRIDCAKGYTQENVRLVCVLVNIALNEWGIEPLLHVARHLVTRNVAPQGQTSAPEEIYMTATEYFKKRRRSTQSTVHYVNFAQAIHNYCTRRSIPSKRVVERVMSIQCTQRWGFRFRAAYPIPALQRVYDKLVTHPYAYL